MADLLSYDATKLLAFLIVFIRVGGILTTAPIFGSDNLPLQIRIGLSLLLTLVISPFLPPIQVFPTQTHHYLLLAGSELLIGLVLGMVGRLLFAAVEFAGDLIGVQMGLAMSQVIDPTSQEQISLIAQYESALATLLFLAMNAHHVVIQALVRSYELLPPGTAVLGAEITKEIIRLSSGIFIIGFQLGAPLIVSLFFANILLGLLARSVPQIQVFVVGFPLTLLLGMVFLMVGMPYFIPAVRETFNLFDNQIYQVLSLLKAKG